MDLQLEKSKVGDGGVAKITGLPLKSLNLNYTAVTDAAMESIGKITTLESIQLDSSRITDVGMVHVAKLTNLKRLRIRDTDVTGDGLQHVAGLQALIVSNSEAPHSMMPGLRFSASFPTSNTLTSVNVEFLHLRESPNWRDSRN